MSRMNLIAPGRDRRAKTRVLLAPLLAVVGLTAGGLPDVASAASTNQSGARIQFATPIHDFGTIKGGETVQYTYVFTNTGDQLLEITGVRPSCGCTTAGDWSRRVEPGKTGGIPIQFNSGSISGPVAKSITVTCNDTNRPSVVLQFVGNIWKAIDVAPLIAALNVTSESPSNSTIVRIVSNEDSPLTLFAPESNNGTFVAELRTNQPGKEFQMTVRTVPPLPVGTVQGQIVLRTSSTNVPVITVSVFAVMQPTVMVTPSQINLPATPLASALPYNISIRNIGTKALVLTDPAVNATGLDVQLREVQPGRYFTLTVTFPAGFALTQSEKVEVSVKSNHPQFPIIKVPVQPPPRRAPVVVPSPGQVRQPAQPGAGAR